MRYSRPLGKLLAISAMASLMPWVASHGIGAGLLVDDDDDGRIPVGVALRRVAERTQLDAADVLDAHDAAVGAHLDDDVLELVGRLCRRPFICRETWKAFL